MQMVWVIWVLVIAVSFGGFEWWALHTGRATLSRTVWEFSKAWPPLPWVAGVLVGFLAAHFWWIGMGCDIANGVG